MARHLEKCPRRLQVLERAGHFAHLEASVAWSQAVREWARGIPELIRE